MIRAAFLLSSVGVLVALASWSLARTPEKAADLVGMPDTLQLEVPASADADCRPGRAWQSTRTVALRRTFAEPFDRLDMTRWTPHFDGGYDWPSKRTISGNGEQQLYVDPGYKAGASTPLGLAPFQIRSGVLSIVGDRAPPAALPYLYGRRYISGLLTSRTSLVQTYGYFEMRGKTPAGQGLWPAFWLLPADRSWPPEIDILEIRGHDPQTIYSTVHFTAPDKTRGHSGCSIRLPDATTAFNTIGVLWEPGQITFLVNRQAIGALRQPAGFDKPMYLLVNLALGGKFGGDVDGTTLLPAAFEIDHIAAYALARPTSGRSQ